MAKTEKIKSSGEVELACWSDWISANRLQDKQSLFLTLQERSEEESRGKIHGWGVVSGGGGCWSGPTNHRAEASCRSKTGVKMVLNNY